MARREHIGEFEHIVLLAVLRLGDEAYGAAIRREIETRTKRSLGSGDTADFLRLKTGSSGVLLRRSSLRSLPRTHPFWTKVSL